MLTQDACIRWIISLVDAADQDAVKLSLAEADAYLGPLATRPARQLAAPT
jgi:hypothetical protein